MNAEPLRITLSKIAPLEQWDSSWTSFGPNVCWRHFRPRPQQLRELWRVIREFEGRARWHGVDNCLRAGIGVAMMPLLPGFPSLSFQPIPARSPISEVQADEDLAALAIEIEKQLGLSDVAPMHFSDSLLTKEGLRKSHGPFEDFVDSGQRNVFLIFDPRDSEVFAATEADIMLHFEPTDDESTAICGDIVGADLTKRDFQSMTEQEAEGILRSFPFFWKVVDYHMGGYFNPEEVRNLHEECLALEQITSTPKAMRGIDKLKRIANWAFVKRYGVFFEPL
jgi:hypothetical protein